MRTIDVSGCIIFLLHDECRLLDVTPCASFKVICFSDTSVLTRATWRHIQGDVILHIHRRKKPKSYIAIPGWALQQRHKVSPVRYELGFYISEDGILHSHCCENLKSCIELTGWALQQRYGMTPVRYELGFYISEDGILHSHCCENLKSYIELTGWALQ
jgi:hypothetical protein